MLLLRNMAIEQTAKVLEQDMAETVRGVQQHFVHRMAIFQERDAAELVCGVERKDERLHWLSW